MLFNRTLRLLSLLLLGFFTGAVSALTSDSQQPIDIVSHRQSVELNNHRMIFSGRVVITQGSIKIQAERVVITRLNHPSGLDRVEATGAPVTFYQRLDDQRPIQGSGQSLQYDAQKGILILQQRAQLKLHDHQIQGDRITYDLTGQWVQVDSTDQQRVKMTLQPEQLQPAVKHKRP
jgi:lipopolysaccharide export system protein LptA